jgi:cell division protein FtsB
VDKWQSLEGKGEKEVESLRKRRVELEVRVKELEVNLKESRAMSKKIAKLEVLLYSFT